MALSDLRDELVDEVASMLDGQFSISVTSTSAVPNADDPAITFPNLDNRSQGTKLITTCVLYIDMRRSTDLNFSHRAHTVAKLYSAFVRAMTRTARYYNGHVRGIIGDRVMVLFDAKDCFVNAVNCAIAMNTISEHIINKHFKANEVKFGIGIDYGNMLATKTGIRKHGREQGNYRNLVWLGRPANVASKLTDTANKPAEYVEVPTVHVAYDKPPSYTPGSGLASVFGTTAPMGFGSALGLGALSSPSVWTSPFGVLSTTAQDDGGWEWKSETLEQFISQLEVRYAPSRIVHKRGDFGAFYLSSDSVRTRDLTPAILMTSAVWSGYRKAEPNSTSAQKSLFKKVSVRVPGYSGEVFGGNVIFPSLKPS